MRAASDAQRIGDVPLALAGEPSSPLITRPSVRMSRLYAVEPGSAREGAYCARLIGRRIAESSVTAGMVDPQAIADLGLSIASRPAVMRFEASDSLEIGQYAGMVLQIQRGGAAEAREKLKRRSEGMVDAEAGRIDTGSSWGIHRVHP